MSRSAQIWLIGLILAAAALRWHGFFTNTFHTDEALFASWARLIAVGRDLTLQSQAVDKPPLAFYLQSVGFPLVGNVSWAARIPNLVASLLLIPLVAQWTWRLYRDELAALIAAAVIALSPLAIQFSGTAFLDPLLTTFLVSALLLVCVPSGRAKPLLAGFVFGLAVATKYQAWLFLPLIGGIAWLFGWRWRSWQRWLVGFLPVVAVVLVFGGGTLLARQWQSYGGIRPIFSWELLPRGLEWLENMAYVTGTLWSLLFLIGIIITFLLQNQRSSRFSRIHPASQRSPDILCPERIRAEIVGNEVANLPGYKSPGYSAAPAEAGLDGLLLAFLVGYLVLHWLLAIPIWERYLLPMLPIFAVLAGRALAWGVRLVVGRFGRIPAYIAALLLILPLTIAAVDARTGRFPIGGWPTADQGASEIAAALVDAPYGTVLYDHWYSWQWRYHFFDTGVYVNWVPHADQLIADLDGFYDDQRYIVLPDSAESLPFQRALHAAGYELQSLVEVSAEPGMILYKIER